MAALPATPRSGLAALLDRPGAGALATLFAWAAVNGGVDGWLEARGMAEPLWWLTGSTLVATLLVFAWYVADSNSRGHRRGPMLNTLMVALAVFAVPCYLAISRPRGARLAALVRALGCFALMLGTGAACEALSRMLA